jgi:S1-C subfamily serine protease
LKDTTRPARRLTRPALLFLASLTLLSGCTQLARTATQVEQRATAVAEQRPAAAGTPAPAAAPASLTAPLTQETIARVAAGAKPGVVQITNEQQSLRASSGALVPAGVGTGFVIDAQGDILTNDHVVDQAQKLQVQTTDGKTYPATLVGRDPRTDLAVVRVQGAQLPVVPLGDSSKLVVGQWVVAIGNALALDGGPTVTAGVVSALGRTVQEPGSGNSNTGGPFLFDVIQTDAAINPGNSGGPLFDLNGNVVGINTLGAGQAEPGVQAQGISFAIAIDTARQIADQLIATGKVDHAFMGVGTVPNSPALARRFGLPDKPGMAVTDVQPGGPAAQAGIQPKDVITGFDGQALQQESDLARDLAARKPGDTATVSIARGDQSLDLKVTLGTAPAS